ARRDWYSVLGWSGVAVQPQGSLQRPAPLIEPAAMLEAALIQRPDLRARQAAAAEAEARLRLARAERFGPVTVGPVYEINETQANFVGLQFGMALPVFNRRRGEILQRPAELGRAPPGLARVEVEIRLEVQAAVNRLGEARAWLDTYQTRTLPELRKTLEEMERLFRQGEPGVDVLRVLDVRRKLLRARDGHLDALREYTQAL